MYTTYHSKKVKIDAYQITSKEKLNNREYPGIEFVSIPELNKDPEQLTPAVKTTHGSYAPVEVGSFVVKEPNGQGHYPVQESIFQNRWSEKDTLMEDLADRIMTDGQFAQEFRALISLTLLDKFDELALPTKTEDGGNIDFSNAAAVSIVNNIKNKSRFKEVGS